MHHDLKQFNSHFQRIVDGSMRAITRFNDRNYQINDTVTLKEGQFEEGEFEYSGRCVSAVIVDIDNFGCADGFVTLSLGRVGLLRVE